MPQFRERNSRAETSGLPTQMDTIEEDEEKEKEEQEENGDNEEEDDEDKEDNRNPYVLINGIPLRKTKEPRTHRCPRCFCYFTRPRSLRDHFPKCVLTLGNPDNLRWNSAVVPNAPYNPEHIHGTAIAAPGPAGAK